MLKSAKRQTAFLGCLPFLYTRISSVSPPVNLAVAHTGGAIMYHCCLSADEHHFNTLIGQERIGVGSLIQNPLKIKQHQIGVVPFPDVSFCSQTIAVGRQSGDPPDTFFTGKDLPFPDKPPQKPPNKRAANTQNTLPKWKAVFSGPTGISIFKKAKPM